MVFGASVDRLLVFNGVTIGENVWVEEFIIGLGVSIVAVVSVIGFFVVGFGMVVKFGERLDGIRWFDF